MTRKPMTKEQMQQAKIRLLMALTHHVGPDNRIGMGELYEQVFGEPYQNRINDTKGLRRLITKLRNEGTAICSDQSTTTGGYWLAASSSETNAYCDNLKKQALRKLSRVAAIKRISLPEFLGQMQLALEMEIEDGIS